MACSTGYTFRDFRFRGSEFDGNHIAEIPRHLVNAEVLYRASSWCFGLNLRWLVSDTPTYPPPTGRSFSAGLGYPF